MKSKFLTWVSAVAAVALVSGILVVTANAHIGASHSPIETDAPDLLSTAVDGDDTVDFCFDEEVSDFNAAGDFHLVGYDSSTETTGDDAELDRDDENCVEVSFDDDRDVANYTVGWITDGAVSDRSGNDSTQNAADLEGTEATGGQGKTVAPNLEEFDVQSTSQEIDFIFDEQIECDNLQPGDDASNFGFYDDQGTEERGNDFTDCDEDDGTVTVEFDGTPDVDDAERVFYETENGTGDDVCEQDPASGSGCTDIESSEGDVDDYPDLDRIERTDDDEYTFFFDEDLDDTSCTAGEFHVYEEDGTDYTGTTCSEDNDNVEVSGFGVSDDSADNEVTLGAVEDGAVDDDDDGNPNTYGSAGIGSSDEGNGGTDAPDLEEVRPNATDELVEFVFDENIDDNFAFSAGDYALVDIDGDTTTGNDIDDAEENVVTVEFDEDEINDAVGGQIDDGAAEDFNGNESVEAAAGFGTASSPGSTTSGGSTATQTVTTTQPTTSAGPRTIRVNTTITIRYDAKPRRKAAFKGSLSARFEKCTTGRLVELHKNGAGTVGRDTSNLKGNWKVKKRNAHGTYFAKVLKKTYTRRNGDTIICKKDTSVEISV